METPLGEVRGLGSAQEGAETWWHERLTSVASLLLMIWLLVSLIRLPALDYAVVAEWLSSTINATAMLLLIASLFWHIRLGLQVIVEDYVHEAGNKLFCLLLLNFATVAGALFGMVAVLKIALGGQPA